MNPLGQYLTEQSSDFRALLARSAMTLAVAIPVSLRWKSFALAVFFASLNVVLWTWRRDAIPIRDVGYSLLGLLLLLLLGAASHKSPRQQIGLTTTRLMSVATPVLMILEILFLLVTPWIILVWSSSSTRNETIDDAHTLENLAYVLVPNLFIFQSQIALELIIKERSGMVFWYTVIANSYRGAFGLATWINRYLEKRDEFSAGPVRLVLLLDALSILATILWCSSMVFIAFIWYPCLSKKSEKKH